MWLTNSSVGRKVVMSVTGLFLILFLTFHALMNAVALISLDAYEAVCDNALSSGRHVVSPVINRI